ncbi:hypothetical protein GQ53DRAFT_798986 [Thozetella sp. PMI_491]|nr:hypothetical protein GQ53DRAFT_798986 [Thozetella sp. PMI_491]
MNSEKPWPSFDELPLRKDGPPGNAWGLFGENDQLGRLNLLTPEVVKAAATTEIQTGTRVSLDWELGKPSAPLFGRRPFHHAIVNKAPKAENDDELYLNTQSSTQWDGFRHFGYQKAQLFYNGRTQSDFATGDELGINVWVKNGGIAGRGILLDWADWASRNGITADPCRSGAIPLGDLERIVEESRVEIKPGDILFVRSGFVKAYEQLSTAAQDNFPGRDPGGSIGLEATKQSLRWLWENRFAAVAGDAPTFERSPITGPYNDPEINLHQWCIAGWGMPLGELFDLEDLSKECKRLGRWSFFVTSMPLKVPGGVASPPNAMAIF